MSEQIDNLYKSYIIDIKSEIINKINLLSEDTDGKQEKDSSEHLIKKHLNISNGSVKEQKECSYEYDYIFRSLEKVIIDFCSDRNISLIIKRNDYSIDITINLYEPFDVYYCC